MNFANLFHKLIELNTGFSLQKVSPKTFPQDVITTSFRQGEKLTKTEQEAIVELVKSGSCYRCRVSKGRYHYSRTISNAIHAALESYKRKAKK